MSYKPLKFRIMPFLVLGVVASGCARSQVREQDPQIQSLQSQNQALQRKLEVEKRKARELETQLNAERKKMRELTAQLQAVLPPLDGAVFPVDELAAVPEKYLGKDVIVEGKLGTPPFFRGPGGHFVLKSLASRASIQCYFARQALDPSSRRLLVGKKPLETLRIVGRMVKTSNGLGNQIGIPADSGFEFHVTKIQDNRRLTPHRAFEDPS